MVFGCVGLSVVDGLVCPGGECEGGVCVEDG